MKNVIAILITFVRNQTICKTGEIRAFVFVQIIHLTSGTITELASDKMAAGDDDRDKTIKYLAFIIYINLWFCYTVFVLFSSCLFLTSCLNVSIL